MVEIYSINLWALKLPCFSYKNLTQPRILQQPYSLIFPALNKPRSTPQIIQPHTKKKKPSSSITNTSHRASSSIIFSNLENQPPCHFLWSLIVQATKPFPSLNPWATPAEHKKNTDSSSIFNLRRGPSLFMAFILVLDQDFNSSPSSFSKTDRHKKLWLVLLKRRELWLVWRKITFPQRSLPQQATTVSNISHNLSDQQPLIPPCASNKGFSPGICSFVFQPRIPSTELVSIRTSCWSLLHQSRHISPVPP